MALMAAQVIGAKVRIEVNEEGSYEGYVHNIDGTTRKLTLAKVVSCSTGTRLHGLHHFFPNEINDLTVLEQKQDDSNQDINKTNDVGIFTQVRNEKPVVNPEQSKGRGLPAMDERNFLKKHLQKGKSRRDPSDEGLRMLQKKKTLDQNCNSEDFIETSEDYENFTINPPDIVVIESLEETFQQAIAYISRQRVVGVAWEGIEVGRFGQLCLIQIGCNKCIYIFDIVNLGGRAFDLGLADIMDSADILKVIHNCRHFSDVLYHQYGVSLVNVFDTQVADAIIYSNEVPDKKLPRQTSSLISCLYEYLDLSPDECHFHKVRLETHAKNDGIGWKNRPIKKDLINAAAKTVMYLRELRLAQMERMMEEFIHGVDIYLSCVRDASDEVVRKKFSSTALPEPFYELQSRDRTRCRQVDRETESNESEEQRQVWEEGHNFMVKYEQRGMRVREHKYPPFTTKPERSSPVLKDNSVFNDLTTEIDKLNVSGETPKTQPEKRYSAQNTHKFSSGRGSLWPGNSGIFSQDDFPQLSSDSDSSGQSPRAFSGMQNMMSLHGDARFGRGRAASLIRSAQLPGARKPNESAYGLSSYAGTKQYRGTNQYVKPSMNIGIGQHDRLQFPPDEDLLTSSEIVSTSVLHAVPSGPRVRISHQ